MNLRAKLVRTMVAALALIASAVLLAVTTLHIWSTRQTRTLVETQIQESIARKGYGLVANQAQALRELVADNAFGDVRRLVRATLHDDPELVFGLFLGPELRPWVYASPTSAAGASSTAWRELDIASALLNPTAARHERRRLFDQEVFVFAAPVTGENHAVAGTIIYGVSGVPLAQALERARADSRRALGVTIAIIVALSIATMLFGLLVVRRAAARISQPISELTAAATAIAAGDRNVRVSIKSHDELETLGNAFNQMVGDVDESYDRLASMNRTLEQRVDERTRALGTRNRDMRLVLDTVNEGLLTISREGWLSEERSAKIDQWFGPYAGNTRLSDYLTRIDPLFADSFALSHEAMLEDYLPLSLILAQAPARLQSRGRQFDFSYLPIASGTIDQGLLVVITDVTDRLALVQHEDEQKEVLAALQGITQDRTGFLAAFDEAAQLVDRLRHEWLDVLTGKRLIHTLKGSAAGAGFNLVADLCHKAEDEITERAPGGRRLPMAPSLAALFRRWENLSRTVNGLIGERGRRVVEVAIDDLVRLRDQLDHGAPVQAIRAELARWPLEPADRPLHRLAERGRLLARRLGKGDVSIEISGGGLRLDPRRWARFWSELTHVVRNGVDHGFVPASERAAAGLPAPALHLSAAVNERELVVQIADNGRGIDWPAVRRAAERRGLPTATDADLVAALLSPGFTTREDVSATSGRGVGLAAVGALVHESNGTISVTSQPGEGSTWRFVFPRSMLGPGEGPDAPILRSVGSRHAV
ncbi:MAG TPA: HAMP domain-containing protein [Polyangia bacterium]|jgi:two-component system chemotaxis sensor kinase CheA